MLFSKFPELVPFFFFSYAFSAPSLLLSLLVVPFCALYRSSAADEMNERAHVHLKCQYRKSKRKWDSDGIFLSRVNFFSEKRIEGKKN